MARHTSEKGAAPPVTKARLRWQPYGTPVAGPEGSGLIARVYRRGEAVRLDIELTDADGPRRVHEVETPGGGTAIVSAFRRQAEEWMAGWQAATVYHGKGPPCVACKRRDGSHKAACPVGSGIMR